MGFCRFPEVNWGLGPQRSSALANRESHSWGQRENSQQVTESPREAGSETEVRACLLTLVRGAPGSCPSGTSICFLPPSSSWEPIEKYINEQYEKFLKEEVNIARKKRIPDTRVHCCLYFISPTGHSYVPGLPLSPGLPLVCII